jgi:alpha-aminoadipic semialdehyde synthase
VGIKEIPVEKILPGRIYFIFSHTIKGQTGNMPMLKRFMAGGSTLIDYEKITDQRQNRLVYFGNYAGHAGAIDILWLTGQNWQYRGFSTPLARCRQAMDYHCIKVAHQSLEKTAEIIERQGFPESLSPVVIGITGYGHVSQGAQEIFDSLGAVRITPEELPALVTGRDGDPHKIYMTIFREEHLVERRTGRPFNLQDYYEHPENYLSRFSRYLPYLSILVNAIYWEKRYPRFVTWDDLKALYDQQGTPKLSAIADITCDLNGSIECNVKTADPGNPAYLCDGRNRTITDSCRGEGVVLLAVDNLPAEIPHDASVFFSQQLKKLVPNILAADYQAPLSQSGLCPEIRKAVIVYQGKLTPAYQYLEQFLL